MDVIEQGPDRPPGGAPRGLVVGALALLAAAALVVTALRDEPADPPRPSPTPVTAPSALTPSPVPITGPETRELTGRVVAVGGGGEVSVVDLSTGLSQPVVVDEPVGYAFKAGRSVVLVGEPSATQDSLLYSLGPDAGLRGMTSGSTGIADLSGTGAWVTTYAIGRNHAALRHVALDGRPRGDTVELPAGYSPRAAYRGGLVLGGDEGEGVRLWEPARQRVLHDEPGVQLVAATARRVVWATACGSRCEMTWFDLPNDFDGLGTCRCGTFEIPANGSWFAAELSPDGRRIALLLATQDGTQLTVCRLLSNDCESPPNALTTAIHLDLEWTAEGTLLLAGETGRVAAWRPGWGEVRLLPGDQEAQRVVALGPS